jgi:hypothetical protein
LNVFELQDQVTARVVGAIAPRLEQAEIDRARRKPTESLDAYDLFLRGLANTYKWTSEANEEALRLYYKAIELGPDFSAAYAAAAYNLICRRPRGLIWAEAHHPGWHRRFTPAPPPGADQSWGYLSQWRFVLTEVPPHCYAAGVKAYPCPSLAIVPTLGRSQ